MYNVQLYIAKVYFIQLDIVTRFPVILSNFTHTKKNYNHEEVQPRLCLTYNGTMYDGTIYDGTMYEGTMHNSMMHNGTMNSSMMDDGTMHTVRYTMVQCTTV